ncbi:MULTISPECIES: phosphopantetheine-binding protein [unclassified Kitasatospora]|uniref:phosphopantetheine-binding protein n=1 Tax=unclassified Kitasatospora TaxID=2633591 RepID=UPI00380EF53C
MSTTAIAAEVRAYIVDQFLAGEDVSDLTGHYDLLDSGVIDSLGLVKMLGHLTSAYRLPVDDIDFGPDDFRTIDAIVAMIADHRPAAAA